MSDPSSLVVGAAKELIDVPIGTPMAGFAARAEASTGVLDPISVRAVAIGETVLVTVDVCGLHEDTCAEVRAAVDGVAFVAATHTHSGPCVMPGRLGGADPGVLDSVVSAATRAATRARGRRVPARARLSVVHGLDVARNRRHTGREVDPPLTSVLYAAEDTGAEIAWLVSYACHPVVLDGSNTLLSADYVGPLRDRIEERSPGSVAIFLTGAAGDLNTGHSAESSYEPGADPSRSPAAAHRIGTHLAEAALTARDEDEVPASQTPGSAVVDRVTIDLLPRDELSPDELAANWLAEREDAASARRALLDHWIAWSRLPQAGQRDTWEGRVGAVDLGGVVLLTLPGEPFDATAAWLRNALGPTTIVAGYVDGCPGYFPSADEYEHGGYEVIDAHRYYGMPAPAAPGAAELFRDAVLAAAHRLGRSESIQS